jgi:hypothetical protein
MPATRYESAGKMPATQPTTRLTDFLENYGVCGDLAF